MGRRGYELRRVGRLRNGGSEEWVGDLFDVMRERENGMGVVKKEKVRKRVKE